MIGLWSIGTTVSGAGGRYIGTLVGVVLIVFLNSVLSIMQMPEAYRQIIYGTDIVGIMSSVAEDERISHAGPYSEYLEQGGLAAPS